MAALSVANIANQVASALSKDASPQIRTSIDALALASHACLLSTNFKLIGLGEDHALPSPSTTTSPQPLPPEWNASSAIDLKYSHPQSAMQFLLHISRLGSKTSIQALALGHDKVVSFDVTTKDFISESSLPASPTASAATPEDAQHAITSIFITPSRLTDFATQMKVNIIQKLVPGLQKEGYEDTTATSSTASASRQPQASHPRDPMHEPPTHDPLRDGPPDLPPARPNPLVDPSSGPRAGPYPGGDLAPPGFEDPYDINRPLRPPGGGMGMLPGYGERDLHPPGMGPNDPLRVGPPRGGGGMYMDPTDIGGGGGRPDFNPQVPPGARYDPVGPGGPGGGGVPFDPLSGDRGGPRRGGPGFGGGGMGGMGGMGGRPPNPFGGFGDGDFI